MLSSGDLPKVVLHNKSRYVFDFSCSSKGVTIPGLCIIICYGCLHNIIFTFDKFKEKNLLSALFQI